jgi:hypothetical protein
LPDEIDTHGEVAMDEPVAGIHDDAPRDIGPARPVMFWKVARCFPLNGDAQDYRVPYDRLRCELLE